MREWIAQIDAPLRDKVRRLMVELLLLAEGSTTSWAPSISHGKSQDKPPPETHSLYEKYAQQFRDHLGDDAGVEATYIKAQAELEAFKGGAEQNDRITIQRERSEAADIQNLISHGQGIPAAVISARYSWPIGWVRHVRQRNGQDPDSGWTRPKWRELSHDDRYAWVQECKDEGMSQRESAVRLGISKGSVQRYWGAEGQENAA